MKNIIVYFFQSLLNQTFWLLVIGHQHQISERSCHVELLDHRKHIANTSEIPNSSISIISPYIIVIAIKVTEALSFCIGNCLVNLFESGFEEFLEGMRVVLTDSVD